jgi:hypothetical protein
LVAAQPDHRDPSPDPQLVWKGKDEQDQQDLAVPSVPIYIQEKIHPQTIIEDVRRTVQREIPAQFTLFADFNGLEFEEMIDFYRHGANWSNRMILGDSLYVMTSLAEKEGLKGQVQMIYIDPPYGIKFGSNWQFSPESAIKFQNSVRGPVLSGYRGHPTYTTYLTYTNTNRTSKHHQTRSTPPAFSLP